METREKIIEVAREAFDTLEAYADTLFSDLDLDIQTLRDFSSKKVQALLVLLKRPEVR